MIQFRKGFYADVRIEDRSSTEIIYQDGRLQELRNPVERQAFLRVYDGKLWYYASVTDLDHLQATLDGLYATATENPRILEDPIVQRFEVNRDSCLQFRDCSVRDVPLQEKQALLKSYLPLFSAEPRVTMVNGFYKDRNSLFHFQSSLGAELHYDFQICGISLRLPMVDGEKQFQGYWTQGDTRFEKLKGLEPMLRESVEEQLFFLRNSVPAEPGSFPVVLSPDAVGMFAHESFGHHSEADHMLSDESIRAEWKLGKRVGSPLLSIVDYGGIPGNGYVPYDDEGTRARKNYLIQNGVLTGRLHNAQTAAVFGEALTGNARALDCSFEPIVRMTSTYVEGGDLDFEALIAPIQKGYYIKSTKHGTGLSTFTMAPNLAYEIIDGKLGRPVQISVLTGSVFETLGLVDGVGRDVEIPISVTTQCGKMEQQGLPVACGGPSIRVSSMNIL